MARTVLHIKPGRDRAAFIRDMQDAGLKWRSVKGLPQHFIVDDISPSDFPFPDNPAIEGISDGDVVYEASADEPLTIPNAYYLAFPLTGNIDSWALARTIRRRPPWNRDRLQLPFDTFYRGNRDGDGVDVYVIDTLIRETHEQFGDRATNIHVMEGTGDSGHGSSVASAIGGSTLGFARKSLLWGAQWGDGTTGLSADIIAALGAAKDHYDSRSGTDRPAVVNCSFSGPLDSGIQSAINSMLNAGMVVLASVHNAMVNIDGFGAIAYPAKYNDVIAVAGLAMNDTPYYAPTATAKGTNWGVRVDVSAPSQSLPLARNGSDNHYVRSHGTSYGVAYAAGVVACILQGRPRLANRAAVQAVREEVRNDSSLGIRNRYGVTLPDRILYFDPNAVAENAPPTPAVIAATATGEGEITVTRPTAAVGADSVELYRATTAGDLGTGGPTGSATLLDDDDEWPPYVDDGLGNGFTAFYAEYATNPNGTVRSNVASATTPGPPGTPVISAAPGAVGEIDITTVTPGSAADTHEMYASDDAGNLTLPIDVAYLIDMAGAAPAVVTDGALGFNKTRYYRTVAENTYGSTPSAIVSATSSAPSLALWVVAITETQITVGISGGTSLTDHKLYRSTDSGVPAVPGNLIEELGETPPASISDSGLTPDTLYYYRLTGYDPIGDETFSSTVVSARTLKTHVPAPPVIPNGEPLRIFPTTSGLWIGALGKAGIGTYQIYWAPVAAGLTTENYESVGAVFYDGPLTTDKYLWNLHTVGSGTYCYILVGPDDYVSNVLCHRSGGYVNCTAALSGERYGDVTSNPWYWENAGNLLSSLQPVCSIRGRFPTNSVLFSNQPESFLAVSPTQSQGGRVSAHITLDPNLAGPGLFYPKYGQELGQYGVGTIISPAGVGVYGVRAYIHTGFFTPTLAPSPQGVGLYVRGLEHAGMAGLVKTAPLPAPALVPWWNYSWAGNTQRAPLGMSAHIELDVQQDLAADSSGRTYHARVWVNGVLYINHVFTLAHPLPDGQSTIAGRTFGGAALWSGIQADVITCQDQLRVTFFEKDGITALWGEADGNGVPTEGCFHTSMSCPRPYLKWPEDVSSTKVEMIEGKTIIGGMTLEIVDVRLDSWDQKSGIITSKIDELLDARAYVERWVDGEWRHVMEGVVTDYELTSDIVTYSISLSDARERENQMQLFTRNETWVIFPEEAPVRDYGYVPLVYVSNGETILPKADVHTGSFTDKTLEDMIPRPGRRKGFVSTSVSVDDLPPHVLDAGDPGFQEVHIFGGTITLPNSGYPNIAVRWRPAISESDDDWVYLRDMFLPGHFRLYGTPDNYWYAYADVNYVWNPFSALGPKPNANVYLEGPDEDMPAPGQSIDVQVLAVRTTPQTPYVFEGTARQLFHLIHDGHVVTGQPYPTRYDAVQIASRERLDTPMMFKLEEPVTDVKNWLEHNLYMPLGLFPAWDWYGRLILGAYGIPPLSGENLPMLSNLDVVRSGTDWSTGSGEPINEIIFKYRREWGETDDDGVRHVRGRDITHRYVGEEKGRKVEYNPVTIRSIGLDNGEPQAGGITNEVAYILGVARMTEAFMRGGYGVSLGSVMAQASSETARNMKIGDFFVLQLSWFYDPDKKIRGADRIVQCTGIIPPLADGHWHFDIADVGPNLSQIENLTQIDQPYFNESRQSIIPVSYVHPGTVGVIQTRIVYPQDFWSVNPGDWKLTATEWFTLGSLQEPETLTLWPIPEGEGWEVWVRYRTEAPNRVPSEWSVPVQVEEIEWATPVLFVRVTSLWFEWDGTQYIVHGYTSIPVAAVRIRTDVTEGIVEFANPFDVQVVSQTFSFPFPDAWASGEEEQWLAVEATPFSEWDGGATGIEGPPRTALQPIEGFKMAVPPGSISNLTIEEIDQYPTHYQHTLQWAHSSHVHANPGSYDLRISINKGNGFGEPIVTGRLATLEYTDTDTIAGSGSYRLNVPWQDTGGHDDLLVWNAWTYRVDLYAQNTLGGMVRVSRLEQQISGYYDEGE